MEDELDRVLSKADEIVPSSGFVMSVMDAVRREAEASEPTPLPPIAFPWMRALPIFVAVAAVGVLLIAGFAEILRAPAATEPGPLLPPVVTQTLVHINAGWLALALVLALLSTLLSIRFAVGRR